MKKMAMVLVALLLMLVCVGAMAEGEIEIVQQGCFSHSTILGPQLHVFAEIKNVSEQNIEMASSSVKIGGEEIFVNKFVPDVLKPGETGYVYGTSFKEVNAGAEIAFTLKYEKTRMAPLDQHEVKGRLVSVDFGKYGASNAVPALTITNKADKDVFDLVCLAAAYDANGKLLLVMPVEAPSTFVIPVGESGTLHMLVDNYLIEGVFSAGLEFASVQGVAVIPFE